MIALSPRSKAYLFSAPEAPMAINLCCLVASNEILTSFGEFHLTLHKQAGLFFKFANQSDLFRFTGLKTAPWKVKIITLIVSYDNA